MFNKPSYNYHNIHQILAIFAYLMVCIRGYFQIYWENPLYITIFLNLIIFLAIDLTKIRKMIWFIAALSPLTIFNRDALALIDILAMVYILKRIPIKYIIGINLTILIIFLTTWYYYVSIGEIFDEVELGPKGYAHYMGFSNPNVLGMQGFTLICSIFLICKNKLSKFLLVCLIPFVNQAFYEYSLARTPWIAGYVLMACIILHEFGAFKSGTKYFIGILPTIVIASVIYAASNSTSLYELNMLTSGRIRYAGLLLMKMSPINFLIGMPIPEDLIIDNSYLMIMCDGGIFSLLAFLIFFYRGITKYWARIEKYIPFIIAIASVGITENSFASVSGLTVIFWYIIFNPQNANFKEDSKQIANITKIRLIN